MCGRLSWLRVVRGSVFIDPSKRSRPNNLLDQPKPMKRKIPFLFRPNPTQPNPQAKQIIITTLF